MMTPDRIRMLEGVVRGTAGSASNPDGRLDAIEFDLSPAIVSGSAQPSNTATQYFPAVGARDAGLASENAGSCVVMPFNGNLRNMYVSADVAPGASKSWTITVRKNGVDTSMVVTLSGASQTTGQYTGSQVSFTTGDKISVKITPSGTPAAARISWGIDGVRLDQNNGGSLDTLLSRGDA
jgi:hypothetical protein